ncbi:hypothetical protein GCM10009738_81910 [Kitasatospora viridis]|uniref:Uncharacterized protein n=1 Tax=Kitasatospora viridis TaxID=281105 RepID=A0A561UP39_9ACTN|nr:hypothetical protein FHX73_114998 [Kitasatospora viridis]
MDALILAMRRLLTADPDLAPEVQRFFGRVNRAGRDIKGR